MSEIINIEDSLSFNPSGYTGLTNLTLNSNYPITNGYTDTSSTTYASFATQTTAGYIYYTFSVSGIPSYATITSVTCTAKIRINKTNLVSNTNILLYTGTTAKGSSSTFASTSSSNIVTLDTGSSWTVNEVNNIRLRFGGTKAGSSNTGYIYFYGANLTINYSALGVNYEIISTLATDLVDSINPAGLTEVFGGEDYTLNIYANSIDDILVEDNGSNVTSSLVLHAVSSGGNASTVLGQYTLVSGSFNGSGNSYFQGLVGKGVDNTKTTSNYYSGGSGTIAVFTYKLVFGDIPSNATITNLYVEVNGHAESTSNSSEYMCAQLRSGNTELSSELNFKSVGTSNSTQTITATTLPTVEQLEDLVLYCRLGYYGGALNGATCYIEYTTPSTGLYYWTYSLSNVDDDHTIIIQESIIDIPEEDPTKTYHSVTISSINATTDPVRGTTRVEEGENATILIYPTESQVTLILDNGVDVSSSLVSHSLGEPSYTVTNRTNTYGFTLNNNNYYESNNTGVSTSAAVARVNLNLPVTCLVTFQYINYAEATFDFGVFGKLDTTLSTSAWTSSSSSGDTSTDAGLEQIRLNTNSYNTSAVQTLTYEVPAGEHYIDVKYAKDAASNENNDSLLFKVSITPTEANNYYSYTLNDIDENHSLIFVFGNVNYYFITSSGSSDCRLYPDGLYVVLEGDAYRLVVVPINGQEITLTDNGNDVTSLLQVKESTTTKEGVEVTTINYIYLLSNINAAHTLVVSSASSESLYIKLNGSWVKANKVYRKISGSWLEIALSSLTDNSIYVYKS